MIPVGTGALFFWCDRRKEGKSDMAEPRNQDKPASYWLNALGNKDEAVQEEAVQALRRIGRPAVPELI
jgi:hypothetical protein